MPESPKKRFLQSPHAKKVAELSTDPSVLAALDAAILQMSWEHGTAKHPDTASACHWQLTGAHKLRELFLSIGIPEKPLPKLRGDNLPNQV
jgi:hypothetical protein